MVNFIYVKFVLRIQTPKTKESIRSPQSLKRHIRTDHEKNYRKQCEVMKQKDDSTMEKCSFGCDLQEQLDRHCVKEHGLGRD